MRTPLRHYVRALTPRYRRPPAERGLSKYVTEAEVGFTETPAPSGFGKVTREALYDVPDAGYLVN